MGGSVTTWIKSSILKQIHATFNINNIDGNNYSGKKLKA